MSQTPDEDSATDPETLDAATPEHDHVEESDTGGDVLPTAQADHDSSEFSNRASDAVTFSLLEPDDQ